MYFHMQFIKCSTLYNYITIRMCVFWAGDLVLRNKRIVLYCIVFYCIVFYVENR